MKKILLFVIICLAFIVRLYGVSSVPPALSWDEVSIGYNAYSILKTGKDEHGRFLPLDTFTAYGDYKPPIPIYLTIPSVALFGLTDLAVRMPSVLSGTITVYLTYILIRLLFHQSDKKKPSTDFEDSSDTLAFLTAAILSISPWHIQLSRAAYEANIALTLLILGVVFMLSARKKAKYYYIAFLPFIGAVYTFNSARYFAPILVVLTIFLSLRTVISRRKYVFTGVIIAFITLIPITGHLISKESRLRFEEVNIFNDYTLIFNSNRMTGEDNYSLAGKIFHNRRIGYIRSFLTHYFDHFEGWFLFIRGDGNPKFSTQDTGQLYLMEFPLLLIGIYYALTRYRKQASFLLIWLATAIIPAGTARETPHALRTLNTLPVWQIFIAFGILAVIRRFLHVSAKKYLVSVIVVLYLISVSYFLHNYFRHYPTEYSGEWQFGYREAIEYSESVKYGFDTIVVTEDIGRPYMYTLFYGRYDPGYYLRNKKSYFDAAGFYHVDSFGKYRFVREIPSGLTGKVLYIAAWEKVPNSAVIHKRIDLLNGKPILGIYEL